jgi:hypothetical protein
LAWRYFLQTYLVGTTMYYRTYYFANDRFAYRGRPAGGLPDCPAGDAPDGSDGCVPYSYDPPPRARSPSTARPAPGPPAGA